MWTVLKRYDCKKQKIRRVRLAVSVNQILDRNESKKIAKYLDIVKKNKKKRVNHECNSRVTHCRRIGNSSEEHGKTEGT